MITSLEELNQIREECKAMVTKRAAASGLIAIVPIPGTDIAADIGMLLELLPAISKRFGLSEEQIGQLDDTTKMMVIQITKGLSSVFVGQIVTKELIMQVLKKIAGRIATKQILRYIPFVGQAAAAGISFGAMKYVGNSHVDECYQIVFKMIEKQRIMLHTAVAATCSESLINEEGTIITKQETIETLKMLKELLDAGIIAEEEFQHKKKELLLRL